MIETVIVAAALLAGLDLRIVGLIAVGVFLPLLSVCLLVFHVARNRPRADTSEAVFCQAIARELRSGSTLRTALEAAASSDHQLLARVANADSLSGLAPMFKSEFRLVGTELASLVEAVAVSGTPSAALFDEVADLALAQLEIADDIRIATAAARASAYVLVGLPMAYLLFQVGTGRLNLLLDRPSQQALTMIGWCLVLVGVLVGWLLIKRAST